ncbi:MAG: succinate dehydrogenase iron-sulfur subunit [Deltaproteobacteria bacterium]|nr:succinate dehydrogenase iron-sulfur subunit [Deltaproteobacteria bacterium]
MAKKSIAFKIRRQDSASSSPYWQQFEIPYQRGHNVVSALMAIRENPVTAGGERVDPVLWECNCMEEVCGACTMVIGGVPRQACAALVDQLAQPIVLRPLSKFPVVRDLMVDRQRMFDSLRHVRAWIDIDGSYDVHERAPRISPQEWEVNYAFSRCMTCGCCAEACPQYGPGYDFVGPSVLGQVRLMNAHPTGRYYRAERLHEVMGPGGLSDCGNAQNCAAVCPKKIPLTTAIGELGRQTTIQALKDLLG